MTIVLVILAVLILLAVLFLIFSVSKLSEVHKELKGSYYNAILDNMLNLQKNITTQIGTLTTFINSQQEEVVRLTNKVEESNSSCKNEINALKHTITTFDAHLDARITAPIDKINDTHNRIKTLGKGSTSTDELRTVVAEVVSVIVAEAVDTLSRKSSTKTKTVKKTDK